MNPASHVLVARILTAVALIGFVIVLTALLDSFDGRHR